MNLRLEDLGHGIRQVVFDRPDSSANVFDRQTVEELDQQLDELERIGGLKGVLFTSAKPSIFIAGADINELLAPDLSREDLGAKVREGQRVFNRVAAWRVPTVAAIHGACLGGGLELCLACDYRLASKERVTRIGLPETSLGIVPAWGGCTRLPRLIGLPKALDCILKGRRLAARQALKLGLVDQLVPREHFIRIALEKIAAGKPTRKTHALTNNKLVAGLVTRKVGPSLEKKTRGHYPAIPRALEVVTEGVSLPIEQALAREEAALGELAQTDVCRQLVRIFFLQERAKRLKLADPGWFDGASDIKPARIEGPVAVVGAGVMGAGIAQWLSARGHRVLLKDINPEQVNQGMARVGKLFGQGMKRHLFTKVEARQGLDRISPVSGEVPLQRVPLVIEAAVEEMEIKKKIFADLATRAAPDTILATNTSALSITELGRATPNPERVIGIHFFNPVHRMQLVEIVVGDDTSPDVAAATLRFVQGLGKLPAVVRDRPGFVVNRILMPYLSEAGQLFASGASVEDIDETMLDFGMPMGPLRLIDEVGVDVARHVAGFLGESFGDRMPAPGILDQMTERGWLGRKSGKGFYLYGGKGEPAPNPAVQALATGGGAPSLGRHALEERMVLVMLNEAARCLEEGVAAAPEDVDFAMIMGTGFAPFRGGPLRYADSLGATRIVSALQALAESEGPRFAPAERLVEMAEKEATFYEDN